MHLLAHHFLDEQQIPYQKRTFPPTTEKGAASVAQALGCRKGQMVKTLIFTTKAGEHVMVLLPADKSAVSGHLKKALGSRNIRLAHPDAIRDLTGYEIGSMSIIAGARNLDNAKKFYDWALTADVQSRALEVKAYQVPSNVAAFISAAAPDLSTIKLIDYDFKLYGSSAERKRLLKKWDDEVSTLPR